MLAVRIEFSDHVPDDRRLIILSFLNTVSGAVETLGRQGYDFSIPRPSRAAKTRAALAEWEQQGLIRWRETGLD